MHSKKSNQDRAAPEKLGQFVPEIAFAPKTLGELNASVPILNNLKANLSNEMGYYLKEYKERLDIPRLCRALAVPGNIAREYILKNEIKQDSQIEKKIESIPYRALKTMKSNLDLQKTVNEKDNRQNAILEDLFEIATYLRMYCEIEAVFRERELSFKYIYGNSFAHLIDIVDSGALITRFKYVGERGNEKEPLEKIISYHPMSLGGETVLAVHVEGDLKFSMFKKWGLGDERLIALYTQYNKRIIRWGKEDVLAAIKGTAHQNTEFLY